MRRRTIGLVLAVLLGGAAVAGAQGFDDIFTEETPDDASDESGIGVEVQGEIGVDFRSFFDDAWESEVDVVPSAQIDLVAGVPTAEARLSLYLEVSDEGNGGIEPEIIDEISVTSYFGGGRLTAGLLKIEWGTGDGIHAIDPLNASDQSGGPTTDYLSSRIPEPMLHLSLYLGASSVAELVYKPFFHPTAAALTGRWAVIDIATIPGYSSIEPVDANSLEYSQAAARLSGSIGPVDLGALYYVGFMPEPGYAYTSTFTGTDPYDPTHYTVTAEIVYTRAQLVGAEAAAALGPFTFRGEAGFWLSEDVDGTAVELYNSRLVYLGGFDVMLPGTSLLAGAQVLGSYTLATDELSSADVDRLRLFEDASTSHLIVGVLEAPFARGMMNIRIAGSYAIEASGYFLSPSYTWRIRDGVELELSGMVIGGEPLESRNSPFYSWRDNDSVSLALRYQF